MTLDRIEAYWRETVRLDAQNAELRAEVERLRAALQDIIRDFHAQLRGYPDAARAIRRCAEHALENKP